MSVGLWVVVVCAVVEGVSLAGTFWVLRRLYRHLRVALAAAGLDPLTAVMARSGLLDRIAWLRRRGRAPGVLLLDLLRFKDVNDRWGHDAGDDLLIAVAGRLTSVATANGAEVGRLGGDEFVFLLPSNPSDAALTALAGRIQDAMAEPFLLATVGVSVQVRVVIGAASAPADPVPGKPFQAADIACYQARWHRQPFAIYRPGMVHPVSEQRHGDRLRDLRQAPAVAVFDAELFARMATGDLSSDRAHLDDIAAFADLLELLDPRGRDFGTDVQNLTRRCVDHEILRLADPIDDIHIEPTVTGDARDGGFRVLITVTGGPTLASAQLHPRTFIDSEGPVAVAVMTTVAAAVTAAVDLYRASAVGSLR